MQPVGSGFGGALASSSTEEQMLRLRETGRCLLDCEAALSDKADADWSAL